MRNFALLMLFLAAACAPMVRPDPQIPATLAEVQVEAPAKIDWQAADTPEKCATISGNWRPICMRGMPACVVTYKDAGKACTDSSQCSGRCITAGGGAKPETPTTGICTTVSDPCGCFQIVENGKAGYAMCAD